MESQLINGHPQDAKKVSIKLQKGSLLKPNGDGCYLLISRG